MTQVSSTRIPMTVIGGFLGAGKTTLLNRVLSEPHGVRYAVLVNDFGAIAVDDALVRAHDGDTVSFANGCVCCSLGTNLAETISKLARVENPPDQFLVEASGVANPRAIADMATLHPDLNRDMIVVMVDADSILSRSIDPRLEDTVVMQLKPADLIVMNKMDIAVDVSAVRDLLKKHVNCPVVESTHADIALELLRAPVGTANDLANYATRYSVENITAHRPDDIFDTRVLRLPDPVDVEHLSDCLRGAGLLRAKGFVSDLQTASVMQVEAVGSRVMISVPDVSTVRAEDDLLIVTIGLAGAIALDEKAIYSGERPSSVTR